MAALTVQRKNQFWKKWQQKTPILKFEHFEIWYDEANRAKMEKMAEAYGFKPSGVPTTFIGDQYWVGYSDTIKDQMQAAVAKCLLTACPDSGEGIIDTNGQSGIDKTSYPGSTHFRSSLQYY